jgi:hypothetical protein
MQPIGVFAVAVGILSFVLIAVVSLRAPRARRRRGRSDGGPFIPGFPLHDDDWDDHHGA